MAAFPSRDRGAFVAHQRRIMADAEVLAWTVVADAEIVGSIGTWSDPPDRLLGYWIGRAFWRRGYATAAVREALRLDPTRPLRAHVAIDNGGSRRVLGRCGFMQVEGLGAPAADGVVEVLYELGTAP
jgi:RimJ/RimL family protein N-acetyltransferase